ncbi:AAA family ATPase [Tsukamurella ocularis]
MTASHHPRAIDRCRDAWNDAGLRWYDEAGDRASAQAPGHTPADRSVTFKQIDGMVLVNSHADDKTQVLDTVGLTEADLYDTPGRQDYRYPDGREVLRLLAAGGKKTFRQQNAQGKNSLYRTEFPAGAIVYVVEGEKDCHAAEAVGAAATCSAMGAGKAHLADWSPLAGHTVIVVRDKDEPGHRHAAQVAEILTSLGVEHAIAEAVVGKDLADHVAAGRDLAELVPVEAGPQTGTLEAVCLADVAPERITWLWPGRIPAGKLVTLDGDPSLGKSTLALTFAATITSGAEWPDGAPCEHPGAVVLLSGEDGLADTVRPRLDAAGADVTRVHAVSGITDVAPDGTVHLVPPTLADVRQLGQLVERVGARLLVVDVLMAYLPSKTDAHRDQDVRRILSALADMADRTGCTVLLLRHLNKAKGGDPMYRGGGSIGIVGAARAGMLVAADPEDSAVRVLASVKSNLGVAPSSLRYTLTSAEGTDVARVEWLGVDERDARTLLAEPDQETATGVDEWLREHLAAATDRQMKATDVFRDADANGYSKDQVKRAKRRLGVKAIKDASAWWWSLPFALEQGSGSGNKRADTQEVAPLLPSSSDASNSAPLEAREQGSERRETCPDCAEPLGKTGRCVNCIIGRATAETPPKTVICTTCGITITAPTDAERAARQHDGCMSRDGAA